MLFKYATFRTKQLSNEVHKRHSQPMYPKHLYLYRNYATCFVLLSLYVPFSFTRSNNTEIVRNQHDIMYPLKWAGVINRACNYFWNKPIRMRTCIMYIRTYIIEYENGKYIAYRGFYRIRSCMLISFIVGLQQQSWCKLDLCIIRG